MSVLCRESTLAAIRSLHVPTLAEQKAFTEAVAHEAAEVTKVITGLDLAEISRSVARAILTSLR